MMACDFMLPGFKLLKKVNWSSEMDSECDVGKLKNKTNTTILTEENIDFLSTHSLKQAVDIENGINLTSKPNEIEKISTNDSTLLVVFDLSNKSHLGQNSTNNNNTNHATVTNMTMSNPRIRKTKLNSFLKLTTNTETQNDKQSVLLSKYFNNDNFETVKSDSIKMPDTFDKEENNDNNDDDDNDDNESVDSLNYASYLNDKNCTNKNANASGNGDGKLKKKLAYDDSKKEAGEEVTDIDDDDDDEKEWQNLKKSSLKQKSKENSGKLPFMSF